MSRTSSISRLLVGVFIVSAAVFTSGCEVRQRMFDQPKYEPLEESDFFGDRRSARPLIDGTVARGALNEDEMIHQGTENGAMATRLPFPVTEELLNRGQERFNIYCAPCHNEAATGDGMVVRRGFRQPSSLHDIRFGFMPDGYFYYVMTQGFGTMPSYTYQIKPEDRWAIVAYIRALQLSQNATIDDVPEEERARLMAEK